MSAFPHVVLVLAHGSIVVWMFRLWRTKRAPGDLLIATICGTIAYDNLIGIIAVLSGTDAILESMSGMRWAMHSIFTPFMMIIVMEISAAAGNRTRRIRSPAAGRNRPFENRVPISAAGYQVRGRHADDCLWGSVIRRQSVS